jgi:hypothetical protein
MDDSVKQQTSDEFLEEMFSELQDQQSFSQIQLPDGADLGSVHRNLMADGQNIAPLIGQTMLPSQYVVDATQFKTPWSSISPLQQPHVLPTTESRTIRQEMQVVLER